MKSRYPAKLATGPELGYAKQQNSLRAPAALPRMAEEGQLVLCVDDERVGLTVRRLLLERAGYRVLTAADGPSGLDLFTRESVHAVVLDYAMPGMHGGEVAQRMRQAKPRVPILLLSAYVNLPTEVVSLVDRSMTKGEGAAALLQNLKALLPGDEQNTEGDGQPS